MKLFTLSSILILISISAYTQNLIGYKEKDIRKYMKENYRSMNPDKVINNSFKYLKYSDNSDSETKLFFLNSDSVCKSIRMNCDFSIKPEKVKEFNTIYSKISDSRWIDKRDGKNYFIEIKDEKWSFLITIETDK